ncbi:histidine phosphatase family protein [Nevskia ramosa]|uniref:histidine phosphatase family protein n=1 Tax=Nevskia ramosa TaxID=64002 RepID=UPI0003B68A9D|nr:histidine phosphatase family protein [Nevskia ramosa]
MLSLTLLRHGAVDERPFVLWGQLDPPVSAAGHAAMQRAVAGQHWTGVISSPLQRCRSFAQDLQPDCQVIDDLREMHFGVWQGLTPAEVMASDGARYAAFQADPETLMPPGGEALPAFRSRVFAALAQWRATAPDGDWLCLTHGGVIRVLLQAWLRVEDHWRIAVPPATSLKFLLPEGGDPVLLALRPPCAV